MTFREDVLARLLAIETSLKEHMRRTDLLEKRVDSVWNRALTAVTLASAALVLLKSLMA